MNNNLMNFVLDLGTSGIKGDLWTPAKRFYFDKSTSKSKGGAQALFMENSWFYDAYTVVGNKEMKRNRVYDIRDILRILSTPEKCNDIVKKNKWAFDCSISDGGKLEIHVNYGDIDHVEQISHLLSDMICYIIKSLKIELEVTLNSIGIIVPFDYGIPQFNVLREASLEAHLTTSRVIDERLATLVPYLYFGGISRQDSKILLIDYGISTVTYSFISIWRGIISFRFSKSLRHVSGSSLDRMLLKYVMFKYHHLSGRSLLKEVPDIEVLEAECENAKIQLSTTESCELRLVALGASRNISLRQQELEAVIRLPLLALETDIRSGMKSIQWTSASIDHVIAVGGNTAIPVVKRLLATMFPYSEHGYGCSIMNPSTLGASLMMSFSVPICSSDPWCYRVRIDDSHYLLVGRSLMCLTKDVMLYPIPAPRKGTSSLVRVLVERCHEEQLARALAMPYDVAKDRGVWEYVFGYHYSASFKPTLSWEDAVTPEIGSDNLYTRYKSADFDMLKVESMELSAQLLEDGRMTVAMAQVHNGRYMYGSWRSFTFQNGEIVEDTDPRRGVISEHSLFSTRMSKYRQPIGPLSSCTSSSILPGLLTDRTRSVILRHISDVNNPYDHPVMSKQEKTPVLCDVTCANRHLRTRTMPELINIETDLAYPTSSYLHTMSHAKVKDGSTIQVVDMPRFCITPLTPRTNSRLFFLGSSTDSSSVTACCYVGSFQNGRRHGKGMEYSVSHETVYQGMWENDLYVGAGTLWKSDGCRLEGTFSDGLLHGDGTEFRADGSVAYVGGFLHGQRSGSGVEYLSDGTEYRGEFLNGRWHGKGLLMRGSDVLFEGSWLDGKKHGRGREVINQSIYEGEFWRGRRQGKGRLSHLDGQLVYNGDWFGGKKHGQGKEVMKNGVVYEGSFCENRYDGSGKQWLDGALLYDGEFSNGLRDGSGRVFNTDGTVSMEGMFKKGRLNGTCTIYHGNDKAFYTGNVVDDIPNGRGTEVLASGEFYEGEFVNGLWHGHGRWYSEKKALVYAGEWVYGMMHGFGEYQDDRGLYVGDFIKGEKCGNGKFTLFSGDQYDGEFSENVYNGTGRFISSSGKITYDGEWRNGQRCGKGKVYFGNGEFYFGDFYSDVMSGHGVYYYENGMPKYVGEFRNDMRNGEGVEYAADGSVMEKGFYVNNDHIISISV